jgi:hypothetical protein
MTQRMFDSLLWIHAKHVRLNPAESAALGPSFTRTLNSLRGQMTFSKLTRCCYLDV